MIVFGHKQLEPERERESEIKRERAPKTWPKVIHRLLLLSGAANLAPNLANLK